MYHYFVAGSMRDFIYCGLHGEHDVSEKRRGYSSALPTGCILWFERIVVGGIFSCLSKKNKEMTNNPVCWFEIYVQDIDRAKQFYESVLQIKLERLNSSDIEMWGFPMVLDSFGASGALVKMEGFSSSGNSTLIYFSCTDCAVEAARVPEYGGRMQKSKMSVGQYGFIALAVDTEGNMFGLHSLQ